jgi:hypothetical protein
MAARANGKQSASRELLFISTSIRSFIETRWTVKKSRILTKIFTKRLMSYSAATGWPRLWGGGVKAAL